jgi:hypothetical protein
MPTSRHYAGPDDWIDPIPTEALNQRIVIMLKILLIE